MRNRVIAAGVVAALVLAVGVWWAARRAEQPRPPEGPPAVPVAPAPREVASEAARPPELFGTVEAVNRSNGAVYSFLVRSTTPNTAGWDSEQNAHHRKLDMPCWVLVREGAPVRRRGGGPVEIVVGQTVSAWCSGPMATTYPPGWGADAVVIEPADR
jgi:hypothetical protein